MFTHDVNLYGNTEMFLENDQFLMGIESFES